MKIGIDCRTILNPKSGERAGVGHYTYYLVKHIIKQDKKNSYVLFFDWRFRDMKEFERSNVQVKNFPFSQYNKFLPFTYSHMLISAYLIKAGLDLFHSPVSSLPLMYPKKSVITVHDLAIYKNPSWFPSQIFSTKLLVPQSLRKADKIIAVSKSTKRDLQKLFNIPSEKIKVIYEGVSTEKIPVKSKRVDSLKKFKLAKTYLFFVGTLEPRKNLLALLAAYKRLITAEPALKKYQLIIAGARGYKSDLVFRKIKSLKLSKQVKYLGYITHNQKMDLMKRAVCFIFPSRYEGFGLPVVEAMALGTPVVTSRVSSLPEITGTAALLVNPEKEFSIAEGLKRVLTNRKLQQQLRTAGRRQAVLFNWRQAAQETVRVYERLQK